MDGGRTDNIHLMSAPEGNSEFCFPESLNIGKNVFHTKILFHFEKVLQCSYGWKM